MSVATNIKSRRDDARWEFEVKAEISAEALAPYRGKALKELSREARVDGFRPGHVPENVVLQQYGESAVFAHAAEMAIKHELPEILAQEKANIVDAPKVTIESLVEGKPVSFTARAPLAPEIKLPDYQKIAATVQSKKEEQSVSDDEHAQTLTHIRRERARIDAVEGGTEPQAAAEASKAMEEKDLPALDDAFAISLGYDSAQAFETAVRANIKNEKDVREAEKRRAELIDELVKQSSVKYPAILKEYELDDMEARMAGDIERMGTTFDAYLSHVKKTKDDLRKEWDEAADKRAKVRLVLGEIARQEKIEPDETALAHEIEHAKKHYKNADDQALRAHIAHAMRNEAVLRFLEGDAESVGHTAADH